MYCRHCGYALRPLEEDCPRCASMKQATQQQPPPALPGPIHPAGQETSARLAASFAYCSLGLGIASVVLCWFAAMSLFALLAILLGIIACIARQRTDIAALGTVAGVLGCLAAMAIHGGNVPSAEPPPTQPPRQAAAPPAPPALAPPTPPSVASPRTPAQCLAVVDDLGDPAPNDPCLVDYDAILTTLEANTTSSRSQIADNTVGIQRILRNEHGIRKSCLAIMWDVSYWIPRDGSVRWRYAEYGAMWLLSYTKGR